MVGDRRDDSFAQLIAAARGGSEQAVGEAFEACRAYLLMVAQREIDSSLTAKGGASDQVQNTFLEAQRIFHRFHGRSERELIAWLRQILLNNVANFGRDFRCTAKRDVTRERSLGGKHPSRNGDDAIKAESKTPSKYLQAVELSDLVEQAIERLPADYRQVIRYRYREERPFSEIAELMNRSVNATRKLWSRAIERLQGELDGHEL